MGRGIIFILFVKWTLSGWINLIFIHAILGRMVLVIFLHWMAKYFKGKEGNKRASRTYHSVYYHISIFVVYTLLAFVVLRLIKQFRPTVGEAEIVPFNGLNRRILKYKKIGVNLIICVFTWRFIYFLVSQFPLGRMGFYVSYVWISVDVAPILYIPFLGGWGGRVRIHESAS